MDDICYVFGCILLFLALSATPFLNPIDGFYAQVQIEICEKELPRNQNCRIVAEPIPMEPEE